MFRSPASSAVPTNSIRAASIPCSTSYPNSSTCPLTSEGARNCVPSRTCSPANWNDHAPARTRSFPRSSTRCCCTSFVRGSTSTHPRPAPAGRRRSATRYHRRTAGHAQRPRAAVDRRDARRRSRTVPGAVRPPLHRPAGSAPTDLSDLVADDHRRPAAAAIRRPAERHRSKNRVRIGVRLCSRVQTPIWHTTWQIPPQCAVGRLTPAVPGPARAGRNTISRNTITGQPSRTRGALLPAAGRLPRPGHGLAPDPDHKSTLGAERPDRSAPTGERPEKQSGGSGPRGHCCVGPSLRMPEHGRGASLAQIVR